MINAKIADWTNRRVTYFVLYLYLNLYFLFIFIYFFVYVCVWNNIRKDRKIAQRIMFLLEHSKMKIKTRCFKYITEKRKKIVIIWFLFAKKLELDLVRILIIFYIRIYIDDFTYFWHFFMIFIFSSLINYAFSFLITNFTYIRILDIYKKYKKMFLFKYCYSL